MEQQRVFFLRGIKWMFCDDFVEHWRVLAWKWLDAGRARFRKLSWCRRVACPPSDKSDKLARYTRTASRKSATIMRELIIDSNNQFTLSGIIDKKVAKKSVLEQCSQNSNSTTQSVSISVR